MSFLIHHHHASDTEDNQSTVSFEGGENSHQPNEANLGHPSAQAVTPLPASSSSVIKFYPEWCSCTGSAALEYPQGEEQNCKGIIRYLCQCPPIGPLARITIFLTIFALTWIILSFLIGKVAGLSGPIFAIILLEIVGLFAGMTMKIFGMPTLLAPLILGIILRNIDALDIFEYFKYPFTDKYCREVLNLTYSNSMTESSLNYNETTTDAFSTSTASIDRGSFCCAEFGNRASDEWITPIREIALTLILTRAGTELSPKQLKKLKGVVPALAFIPCVFEGSICAGLFYLCFFNLKPNYAICFVAGFALAAVSPAVVVPGMLSLARKGYGVVKGVPTLLVAASSIDDVLAISLYTVALSLAIQSHKTGSKIKCTVPGHSDDDDHGGVDETLQRIGGPLGIIVGVIYGIATGMILHFLPSKDITKSKGNIRIILLLCCNLACMLGFSKTGFLNGAGSLGVLTTSFVASFGWRSQPHWKPYMHQVETKLTQLWTLFVPILFGTIGKEMRFLHDPKDLFLEKNKLETMLEERNEFAPFSAVNIARIIGIIFVCLIFRCGITFFIVKFAGLNMKERLFVAFAWIPKATVQAALAPLVLSTVLDKHEEDVTVRLLAKNIVVMAVFAILFTAPTGAILIALTGTRLLKRAEVTEIEDEFPNGEPDPDEDDSLGMRPSRMMTPPTLSTPDIGGLSGSRLRLRSSGTMVTALGSNSTIGQPTGGSATAISPSSMLPSQVPSQLDSDKPPDTHE